MNNLLEYQNWLKKRNLTFNTIRSYLWALKEYQPRKLNTDQIINFLKENLTKYQPASLQVFRQALSSYTKFKKIEIEWEMITRLIPSVQKKFFTTIDEKELNQLKQAKYEKENSVYQRNNLMLDFLFFTGIRVSELVNIKHSDYQGKSLKIHGKGNKIRFIFIPDFLVFGGSSGSKEKADPYFQIVDEYKNYYWNKKIKPTIILGIVLLLLVITLYYKPMNNLLFTALIIALLCYFFYYLPSQKKLTNPPLNHSQFTQTDPDPLKEDLTQEIEELKTQKKTTRARLSSRDASQTRTNHSTPIPNQRLSQKTFKTY